MLSPDVVERIVFDKNKDEVHGALYFLSGVATAGIFFGGMRQLSQINQKNKAEFLMEIDRRWCSKEITEVRKELWREYIAHDKDDKKVARYVERIAEHSNTPGRSVDLLFRHLNFIELLGTIHTCHYLKDEDLKKIFGGKLLLYLQFYKYYLESTDDLKNSNAAALLTKMDSPNKKSENAHNSRRN